MKFVGKRKQFTENCFTLKEKNIRAAFNKAIYLITKSIKFLGCE